MDLFGCDRLVSTKVTRVLSLQVAEIRLGLSEVQSARDVLFGFFAARLCRLGPHCSFCSSDSDYLYCSDMTLTPVQAPKIVSVSA